MISLACVDVPLKAYLNVFDCLKSERIGRGKYVTQLEDKFASYIGAKYCLAVSNGTIADIIMLATLKHMYPEKDEVIVPAFTFIAQVNAIIWAGLKPVFVDVNLDNMQIDEDEALKKINEKTLCIFPAHLMGKSAFVTRKLLNHTTPLIEDVCESMGGICYLNNMYLGTIGIAGSFSMYPSHTITTGEGGFIVTDNEKFYEIAKSIHNHGKLGDDFNFVTLGINGKMTNLQAAIGCALIDKISEVNAIRRNNVDIYNKIIRPRNFFYATAPHGYPVFYRSEERRDQMIALFKNENIEVRRLMNCVPDTIPYLNKYSKPYSFPNAHRLASTGLFLPVHQKLKDKDIERIANLVLDNAD